MTALGASWRRLVAVVHALVARCTTTSDVGYDDPLAASHYDEFVVFLGDRP